MQAPASKRKKYLPSDWMSPEKNFPFHGNVYRNFRLPRSISKDDAIRAKPFVRKALMQILYEHMDKAKRGVPGVSAYQVPRREISQQLGLSYATIGTAARKWRRAFGFEEKGKQGTPRFGLEITPKDFIFQQWMNAAATSRKLVLDDIILSAGKKKLLISPAYITACIIKHNKMLDPLARVHIKSGALNGKSKVDEVKKFLNANGITDAVSAHHASKS